MEFRYNASTIEGNLVSGNLEADSETSAEQMLWNSGLTIIDLKRKLKLPSLHKVLPSLFGVGRRDVIGFSRNLASLLDAGIPLLRSLRMLSRHGKASFMEVLNQVISELEEGSSFSEACAKHPSVFPNFYVYLLKTGEEVGNLSTVLKDTASHMERDEAIAAKVKRSLAYPAFVLLLAFGAVFIMLTFVVPALTNLFEEFGEDLPMMTRMVVAVGNFFSASFIYIVIGLVLICGIGIGYVRTRGGKKKKDSLMLKIPILGNATLKAGLSRFTRNMSMLVGAGVSLFEALKLTSETTENVMIAESLAEVRSKVGDGELFSQAMAADPLFPSLMAEMVGVGEETGSLENSLTKVSTYYQEEAEIAISRVTGMLTPALTIVVGLVIGLIAITIFSSIYSMAGVIG